MIARQALALGIDRSPMVRILIADDHEIIRQALRGLLVRRSDWQICGEAANGREAVEAAKRLVPDVVILDVSMPELNGLEATSRIHKALPATEILVLTMHDAEDLVSQVIAAGARGYLLKSSVTAHIEAAIDALARHEPYFDSLVSQIILKAVVAGAEGGGKVEIGRDLLTAREHEIVQLLADGKSNKQIANLLGLAVGTVQSHRTAIMRKFNVGSIAALVRYAVRNRIIDA
jgi:DNA-binding NarL/FixJ family response regulator